MEKNLPSPRLIDPNDTPHIEESLLLYILSSYRMSKMTNSEYLEQMERRLREQIEALGGRGLNIGGVSQLSMELGLKMRIM